MYDKKLYPLGENKEFHQLGEGELKNISIKEFLDRLKKASGTTDEHELAKWLSVPLSHIVDAKKLNRVPVQWLHSLILKDSDYNPLWVLTGQGYQTWAELNDTQRETFE